MEGILSSLYLFDRGFSGACCYLGKLKAQANDLAIGTFARFIPEFGVAHRPHQVKLEALSNELEICCLPTYYLWWRTQN